MFSVLRSRVICQKVWSLPKTLKTLQINHRTYKLSAIYFQQTKPPSILNENENKSPFIFSKTSADPKYTKEATEDEKKERDARAAWDMKMLKYTGYFLGVWLISTLGYVIFVFGGPQLDQNGIVIEDEFSKLPAWQQYLKRSLSSVKDYWQTIKDPTSNKLLPDPLPAPYQPMYTLVIEMSGVLLSPEWAYNTGWRYKKRPGLDYFIKEIGYPLYEVVIYTKETPWATTSVIENMDSEHRIMYRLFRENTRYINGSHVKDLSCLNRDLKKIIYLDWDEKAFQLQPRNALHRLKKWDGQDDDRQLLHLAAFLRMIAVSGVEDVRDVLDHYNQESDPIEAFLLRQHALLEAEEQKRKAAEAANNPIKQSKGLFGSWKRF